MRLGGIIGEKVNVYEEIQYSIFSAKRRIKSNKYSHIKTEIFIKNVI